jgi:hypothetical protein
MTIMNRMLGRDPHEEHLLEDMIYWPDNMDTSVWYYEEVQEATNSHDYGRTISSDGEDVEQWTGLLTVRDWAALEKEWSTADSAPGEEVSDDVSVLDSAVTTLSASGAEAQLTQTTLQKLASDAAARLQVLFSDCRVELDQKALTSLLGQTQGDVAMSVRLASASGLNAAQQAALAPYQTSKIPSATVDSGAVTSFEDGYATVSLAFTPAWGTDESDYSVLYVAEDGTLEYIDSYYQDGRLVFHTTHFSDYAIVRGFQMSDLSQGRLVSPWFTDGKWLVVAVPVAVVALAGAVWFLRRKGGRHERK